MIRLFGWAPCRIWFPGSRITKSLIRVFYLMAFPVWIARAKNRRKEYSLGETFVVAGKKYASAAELRVSGEETIWKRDNYGFHEKVGEFRDIYGRKVYYLAERFPSYDSYDRRYDSRFYRHYYLHEKGKLFRISFPDDSNHFTVTEDVGEIEAAHWEKLKQQQWILG